MVEKMKRELLNSFLVTSSIFIFLATPGKSQEVQGLDIQYSDKSTGTNLNVTSQTLRKPITPTTKILRVSDIEHPFKSALMLVQLPTPNVVKVTGVQINPIDAGMEIILETTEAEQLQVLPTQDGNTYIVDIPNAQLSVSSDGTFREEQPVPGITEVTVINLDTSTIRITVTGEAGVPQAELFDSGHSPGGFFSRAELQGMGRYFFEENNQLQQEPLVLVNARIGYKKDKFGIYLFANNLFDKNFFTEAFESFILPGVPLGVPGDGRTIGVQFRARL